MKLYVLALGCAFCWSAWHPSQAQAQNRPIKRSYGQYGSVGQMFSPNYYGTVSRTTTGPKKQSSGPGTSPYRRFTGLPSRSRFGGRSMPPLIR